MNHCQGERARGGGGITRLERSGGEERRGREKKKIKGEERGTKSEGWGGVKGWRERGGAAEVEGGEEGRIKVRVKSGGFLE